MKIFDKVRIKNSGASHSYHEQWFEDSARYLLDDFKANNDCCNGDIGTVLAIYPHSRNNSKYDCAAVRIEKTNAVCLMRVSDDTMEVIESRLKVGTKVGIKHQGGRHGSYYSWFSENAPEFYKEYRENNSCRTGDTGTVVAIAPHGIQNYDCAAVKIDGSDVVGLMQIEDKYLEILEEDNMKPTENEMANLVYVYFDEHSKNYLCKVPSNVNLQKGDKVYIEPKVAKNPVKVTCSTDSYMIPLAAADMMIDEMFSMGHSELSPVVGRAKEVTAYQMVAFE